MKEREDYKMKEREDYKMKKLRRSIMKTQKSLSIVGMVMATVFVLGLGIANANLIPTNTLVTPASGQFVWTYDVVLSNDQRAISGSYFTIYDFTGYVPGTVTSPSGWTAMEHLLGMTPSSVDPILGDNPGVLNVTWTYSGSSIIPNTATTAGVDLGLFTLTSTKDGVPVAISYTSQAVYNAAGQSMTQNTGSTFGPAPSSVPEPGTLLLLGLGLVGVAGFRKKFKK